MNWIKYIWRKKLHREWQRDASLSALYSTVRFASSTLLMQQKFVVIDCEMTGLDTRNDALLQIAWLTIEGGQLKYGSRISHKIYSERCVGESAIIHGISDSANAGAQSPAVALTQLANELNNAVAVFHHAPIDITFLQRAAEHYLGAPLLFPFVDTLKTEQYRLRRANRTGLLQLDVVAERYGIPATAMHDARVDALVTAQIFLAQYEGFRGRYRRVGDLYGAKFS